MNIRAPVLCVFIVVTCPPQGAEARSALNPNTVTAEQTKAEVKSTTNRHRWRSRQLRHRKRTHHLDPGW